MASNINWSACELFGGERRMRCDVGKFANTGWLLVFRGFHRPGSPGEFVELRTRTDRLRIQPDLNVCQQIQTDEAAQFHKARALAFATPLTQHGGRDTRKLREFIFIDGERHQFDLSHETSPCEPIAHRVSRQRFVQ